MRASNNYGAMERNGTKRSKKANIMGLAPAGRETGKRRARPAGAAAIPAILAALCLCACGQGGGLTGAPGAAGIADDAAHEKNVYAMVSKDAHNPYMKKAYEGFEAACREIGAEPMFRGPDVATPEWQIEIIDRLAEEGVDLISVTANDADALYPALHGAMEKGIKVISFDSAVNKDSRLVHVQQANPEQIGRVLAQAAYEMVEGEGGIAVLSTTSQATNQNLWIEWMKAELSENAGKYAKTPLITIVYGEDEPVKSTSVTRQLLSDPKIKVIVAPTAVGMAAAGKCLSDNGSTVLLTGLGMPSAMGEYIESGVCPWMYLWNPVDLGYLAAYTGDALVNGQIAGDVGDTFNAGNMGERVITAAADGGTEAMLGDLFKFDQTNIAVWKEVY